MKSNALLILLSIAPMVAGCASSAEAQEVLTYDAVTANEGREGIDSKVIVMKGWLSLHPEAKCILQNKYVKGANVPLEEGVTVSYEKSIQHNVERLDGSYVEITGTFHKNIFDPKFIVFGACNRTAIDVKSIKPANRK